MTERIISIDRSTRVRPVEPTEAEQRAAYVLRGLYVALCDQQFTHEDAITIVTEVARAVVEE